MRSIGHFIGGKEIAGTSGRTADVFQPMTGEVRAKVALASQAEVAAAVANAKAAQPAWAATNPQRRARVMMKFLELVQHEGREVKQQDHLNGWGVTQECPSDPNDRPHKPKAIPIPTEKSHHR